MEEESPREHDVQAETISDEGHNGSDNTYTVDKIVQHISSRPHVRYVVIWYAYNTADDTAESLPPRISAFYRGVVGPI